MVSAFLSSLTVTSSCSQFLSHSLRCSSGVPLGEGTIASFRSLGFHLPASVRWASICQRTFAGLPIASIHLLGFHSSTLSPTAGVHRSCFVGILSDGRRPPVFLCRHPLRRPASTGLPFRQHRRQRPASVGFPLLTFVSTASVRWTWCWRVHARRVARACLTGLDLLLAFAHQTRCQRLPRWT